MHKKKDEFRDIYQGDGQDTEKDFSPQVAQERIEDQQRDLLRSRVASVFSGILLVLMSIVLAAMVTRDFVDEPRPARKRSQQSPVDTPKSSLPADALWVMETPEEPADRGELSGTEPLSVSRIKAAANHTVMGQQALAVDRPEEALSHFQKVAELFPDIRGLHRAMGTLYLQSQQYAAAADHLQKAFREEASFDVVNDLGSAYLRLEEYDKAEESFLQALDMQPGNPACHKNLAENYRKMKRDDKAVYHFEKYLDLRPGDLDTMQIYALYLAELNRWKDAADVLTKLTQEITDVAPVYFLLAQVQTQNGQPAKALEALKRGTALIDPGLARTWMSRKEFDALRGSGEFKTLMNQLEAPAGAAGRPQ